jgi:hypothetical protein
MAAQIAKRPLVSFYLYLVCIYLLVAGYNLLLGCSHIIFLKQVLESLHNRLMRHLFLTNHPNRRKHGKAAVIQFFGNHHIESFVGLGLQAKRIESDVTWKEWLMSKPQLKT